MQAVDPSRRSSVGRAGRIIYASGLLVPLVFVLVMMCFAPVANYHELDNDEGIETMKAFLVSKGHGLYTEVWNDEPPLLTLILAQWLKWFGASLATSRILILLFSAVLLWAFYQTIRMAVSEPAALISVALLVLSSYYIRLSISVMIGLPAIALAMLSLCLLLAGQQGERYWLMVVSGIVFGLSIQTKLFTAALAPVILVYLCFLSEAGTRQTPAFRQRLGRCALWVGAMGAAFVVTGFLVGTFDPQQLITPHLGGQTRTAYDSRGNLVRAVQMLWVHVGYLPFAAVRVLWGVKRRIPTVFPALGWLTVALAFVLYQKPLWYHHFLFMTVPLAWLSALGLEAGLRAVGLVDRARWSESSAWPQRLASLSSTLVVGGLVVFNLASRGHTLPSELVFRTHNERIVSRLCPDGLSKPAWVFSDRLIYAFQAGLIVPPPTAALSGKRLVSGQLTEGTLLDILRGYRPAYVVLERFYPNLSPKFREGLGKDYALLEEYYDDGKVIAQLLGARPVNAGQDAGAGQAPARVLFDDWLSLEWTPTLLGDRVEAGNCLALPGLKWQWPTTHTGQDLAISLRLTEGRGNILAQHDEPLGTDSNTMRDRTEMPYFLNFLIPDGTPPGNYDLALIVYDPQTGQPLGATSAAAVAGGGAVLGQVRVDRPAGVLALRSALADFGPVRLITVETPATAVSPGGEVPLDLLWQADIDHHGESFVVVAQLLDDQGKVVTGLEEEPLNRRYGTAGWQPGELVRDHHALSVPADTPAGRYSLIVGLYRLPSGEPLKTPAGLLGWRPRDYFLFRQIEVS